MRKIIFAIIFVIFSIGFSISQNWHLVDTGRVNHYSLDTTNLVFSIYADSVKIEGEDTIFYNNRVILPCDTCHAENYPNVNATVFYLRNQALFLQRTIKLSPNGIIDLLSPESLTINLNDSTWAFNNDSNYQAQLFYKGIYNFLSVSDSVFCFTVNSTDTVIVSKNYGVIQWPCENGAYFRLIGVEGINSIGYHIPTLNEIYDFQVDDILFKEESEGDPEEHMGYYERIKITTVIDSTNSENYQICGCKYIDWATWDTSYTAIDTINNIVQNNYFHEISIFNSEFLYPIETYTTLQDIGHDFYEYLTLYYVIKLSIEDGKTHFQQENQALIPINTYNYDSLDWNENIIIKNTYEDIMHDILMIEGIGLKWNIFMDFEYGTSFKCYKDESENVCEACIVSSPDLNENNLILVYPNPSSGEINISGIDNAYVIIYNLLGKQVYKTDIKNAESLNLKHKIEPGIYFINISSKTKNKTLKLILK